MNAQVDKFIKKSKRWQDEITELRPILPQCKLEENSKWNQPCYT